ncbi:MAG TPA: hypothetical protein VFI52_05410, partial [Gemmatimonadaceae bacterium]|nr:hypothetical protein [Gemmatimonadaceae bacterium]
DLPRLVCLWRVARRWARHRGSARPDMAPGCDEQLSLEFLRWIWGYPIRQRPAILRRLSLLPAGQRAVVLRSTADVERFLATAEDVQKDRDT